MKEEPPAEASSSKLSSSSLPTVKHSAPSNAQPYLNYTPWNNVWPPYSVYPPSAIPQQSIYPQPNSFAPYSGFVYQPQPYSLPNIAKTNGTSPTKTASPPPRIVTPPLPDPEDFKHWDVVLKKFLTRTKLLQTLRGLENDIFVLNAEWEQKILPEALKELVLGLQIILDRISGKKTQNIASDTVADSNAKLEENFSSIDERKLDSVKLPNGTKPFTQSSINKSISQFLSRTRARNNASNRAEFLYTLAEKKRQFQAELDSGAEPSTKGSEIDKPSEPEFTSCARVDAKFIDRDKQIKYDIAKNGEGPLTKTMKPLSTVDPLPKGAPTPILAEELPAIASTSALPSTSSSKSNANPSLFNQKANTIPRKRKRQKEESDTGEQAKSKMAQPWTKHKRKGKQKQDPDFEEKTPKEETTESTFSAATAEKHPGLDERLNNLESHLSIRYVPSAPRTFLARLSYLEEHLIKLEKDYPPWAALHFNQPNRGWPPPPRATPIIVPPHLRALDRGSVQTTLNTHSPAEPQTSISAQPPMPTPIGNSTKPRKLNSSLRRAVLDRLEVQRAMDEMRGSAIR